MVIAGARIPVPGETVSGGKFLMNPGGKGANQAVAVARLSARRGACTFIAKVGDDLFGRETAARLKREGIAARLVDARPENDWLCWVYLLDMALVSMDLTLYFHYLRKNRGK